MGPVEAAEIWSGWDGVGTAAVTLVGPIAYFTRVMSIRPMLLRSQLHQIGL
jgi:hypothetical protein